MSLRSLLLSIPALYAELNDSALPQRTGEPTERRATGDPLASPAPGRIDVMEHRHRLLRGLRWWVDAVRDPDDPSMPAGDSPAAMCAWLVAELPNMAPEDMEELSRNLSRWRDEAWRLIDVPDPDRPFVLPPEATGALVPQAVAARALGVPVSTVWRRNGGKGGPVRIADIERARTH